MAIKVIKEGTPPEARTVFGGVCHRCKTEIECSWDDGRAVGGDASSPNDADHVTVACPVCQTGRIVAYPKRTR